MNKIKWLNVIKAIIFIFCISIILHDLWLLTFAKFITGKMYGFTWFGFFTFILFTIIAYGIHEDFEEQIKSVPVTRNNRYTNK